MKYQRFISYLYQYQNGEKLSNTGFVKVEQKGVLVRISVRCKIAERQPDTYGIYLITKQTEESGEHYGILLSRQKPVQGMLTYQYIAGKEADVIYAFSMEDYLGVMLRGQEGVYMTVWQDAEVDPERILCGEEAGEHPGRTLMEAEAFATEEEVMMEAAAQNPAPPVGAENMEDIAQAAATTVAADIPQAEQGIPHIQEPLQAEADLSGVSYLFERRQPLPPVEGGQLVDCIRIDPRDLGLLAMPNWKYGTNSFLSHGYYKYRYLLLGKVKFQDDAVKLILGVPSIYTNREKYLANMFGFEQFITARRTDRKLGQFGYWIVELAP